MGHRDAVVALVHAHVEAHRQPLAPQRCCDGPLRLLERSFVERTRQAVAEGLVLGERSAEVAVNALPDERSLEAARASGSHVVVGVDLRLSAGPEDARPGSVAEGVAGALPVRPVVRVEVEAHQTALSVAHTPHGWRVVDVQEDGSWFSERFCTHPGAALLARWDLLGRTGPRAALRAGVRVEADYVFVAADGRRSYGLRIANGRDTGVVVEPAVRHTGARGAGWVVPPHDVRLAESPVTAARDVSSPLGLRSPDGTVDRRRMRLTTRPGHPRAGWCGPAEA